MSAWALLMDSCSVVEGVAAAGAAVAVAGDWETSVAAGGTAGLAADGVVEAGVAVVAAAAAAAVCCRNGMVIPLARMA